MSLRKFNATILAALIAFAPQLSATTVVIIVTHKGIAISSDSKTVTVGPNISGEVEQDKVVILQNRIAVAAIGNADWDNYARGEHYHFLTWVKGPELNLPQNVSMDSAIEIIGKSLASKFAAINVEHGLRLGEIEHDVTDPPCETFAEFAIAGYQNGAPRVYSIRFNIDWDNKKLIGPIRNPIFPDAANRRNKPASIFGRDQAITDILNPKSYAHQQALRLAPGALAKISGHVEPTLDETIAYTRALVQIEENTNPDSVGGRIKTFQILPSGRAEEVVRMKTALPKAKARAEQKHQ